MKCQTYSEALTASCFLWLPGDPLPSGKAAEAGSPLHLVLMWRKRGAIPQLRRRPTPSRRVLEHPHFDVDRNWSVCSYMTGFPFYCRMASYGFWELSACSSSSAFSCSQHLDHLHLCILFGLEGQQNMLRVFGGMQMIQILRAKHSYHLCNVHADGTWWSGLTKKM